MRIRRLLPLLALLLALPAPARAGNPIPGVGIVVKRNPGSSSALVVPAGFFGAGSSAFSGTVSLEGRCSHDCGGCADACSTTPGSLDSRLDYLPDELANPNAQFAGPYFLSMPALQLYSTAPISVTVGGVVRSLDVVIGVTQQGDLPTVAISGRLLLAGGTTLDPGSSATVLSSSLDVRRTITFVDHLSGQQVGSSLQQDVQLVLQGSSVSIACVADGTPTGRFVLGQASPAPQPVAFASGDGSLVLQFESVVAPPPVRASGLLCAAVGAATAAPSADARRLPVHNLGSSGQDGVDITLSHLDGHVMSSSSLWSSLDQGTTLSYDWRCSLNGLPPGTPVIGSLRVQRQPDRLSVSCDLSHFSSSATQMRCLAYSGDQLVFDSACPVSTTVELLCPSSSLVPEVSFELDSARRFSVASLSSSNSVLLFGGQSVSCDRVVFVGDLDDDGELDVCAMRATVPLSSSLHDLDFDTQSVVLRGQTVVFREGFEDYEYTRLIASPSSATSPVSLHVASSLFSSLLGEACDDGSCSSPGAGTGRVFAVTVPNSRRLSARPTLVLDPTAPFVLDATRSVDDGVVLTSTYHATSGGSASLSLQPLGGDLLLHSQFSSLGLDHEEVVVLHHGVEVARMPLALDGSVSVSAPPGSPSGAMVCRSGKITKSRSNIQNNLTATVEDGLREDAGTPPPAPGGEPGPTGPAASSSVELGMEFLFDRVFCAGGTCATGDAIIVEGSCASGTCGSSVITITGADFSLTRSSGGWPSDSKLAILAFPSSSSSGSVHAVIPSSVALSSTRPVVHVPVVFDRDDVTAARGTTVTLELSSNLVLGGAITEQDFFSRSGQSQMFVVDNGGGSYTVDCALLGPGCGPTDSGTLFDVPIARAPGAPDGFGTVSVVASEAADCNGAHLTASPAGPVRVMITSAAPAAVAGLVATQVTSGNDADGTTKVSLVWSPRSNVAVELYRAGFGNYPEYDDAPNAGSVPPLPSYPPAGRWSPVALQCGGGTNGAVGAACTDEPSSRDFFYYVAFARDAFGNVSPASDMTTGTLDYHLGDVSNGVATCTGDNAVGGPDISLLGSHYGASVPNGAAFRCLDVGPTSTGTVHGRPLTDNRVSFADFILFAINYSLVSSPADMSRPAAAPANALSLTLPELPEPGATFDVDVRLAGAGDLQGLSAQLAWDAAVVEPIGVASGELMDVQGRQGMVLSAAPGGIDAALLGTGPGIAGNGSLARVTFRVRAAGDAAIRIASVFGRDLENHDVTIANASVPSARTALRLAFPNPFVSATTVVFSLGKTGPSEVGVFDLAGRRVRTLASGVLAAGEHTLSWDGRDADGHRLNAGVYMLRLQTAGHQEVRSIRLVR